MFKQSSCLVEDATIAIPRQTSMAVNKRSFQPHVFWLTIATLTLLFAIYYAYRPVLFNFFAGDDYGLLHWLRLAMAKPEVIWQCFYHGWMDGDGEPGTPLFYRPLINASMALECFIWGADGLLFRVTNLVFLGLGSFFIGLITFELAELSSQPNNDKIENCVLGFVAAALFALYPLHPEAIVWIIGRTDSMCTMFILGSLWFYIRWRKVAHASFFLCSLTSAVLAFTCKEMAIALPAMIIACELCFGDIFSNRSDFVRLPTLTRTRWSENSQSTFTCLKTGFSLGNWPPLTFKRTIIHTAPFILLLALYFMVRRLVLGTFVGGYDNSLSLSSDFDTYLCQLADGLTNIVVPAHRELYERNGDFVAYWKLGIVAATVLSAIVFVIKPSKRRLIALSIFWFVSALVPVYKLFSVSRLLVGSRTAYLATAPLCIFLALGMAPPASKKIYQRVLLAFPIGMLILSTFMLRGNNLVWREAGNIANAIQRELAVLYKRTAGDPQVLIAGLPIIYKGAYVCMNALTGMTKYPQIDRDIDNCSYLSDSAPNIPFGFLKASIRKNREKIKCFYWDSCSRTIKPATLTESFNSIQTWRGNDLKRILKIDPSGGQALITEEPSGNFRVRVSGSASNGAGIQFFPNNLPCWSTDFVAIKLRVNNLEPQPSQNGLYLQYANDINTAFSMSNFTRAPVSLTGEQQEIIFPLRYLPEWSFGGSCRGLELNLPAKSDIIIEDLSVKPADLIIPKLSFEHSQYLESRGTLHLNVHKPKEILTYNAQPGARGLLLEVSPPNTSFEYVNCKDKTVLLMRSTKLAGIHGQYELKTDDFPRNGIYQLRLRAVDGTGKPIGLAGDHIEVLVADK